MTTQQVYPRMVIFDGTNQFIRHFAVNTALDERERPAGAVVGFLRDMGDILFEVGPTRVMVAWDGANGSSRKRTLYKEYKEGRKPVVTNLQKILMLSQEQEQQSRFAQTKQLIKYLAMTPVVQFSVDNCEADDVIAFLVNKFRNDYDVIIVSSDRDFWQLAYDGVTIYRPQASEFITFETVLEKSGAHPRNFALYKALLGDKSDNIKGITRLGEKTIPKLFPFFAEARNINLVEFQEYCEARIDGNKFYRICLENMDIIKRNYQLCQLYTPNLSVQQSGNIIDELNNNDSSFERKALFEAFRNDGFTMLANNLFTTWNQLQRVAMHAANAETR